MFETVVWSWSSQRYWFILFIIPHHRWYFCEVLRAANMSPRLKINWVLTEIIHFIFFVILLSQFFWYNVLFIKVRSCILNAGSFSRSAVNHESGAKTGLAGIVTAIIMGCALLFLTPLFEYIPQVCFYYNTFLFSVGIVNCKFQAILDSIFHHIFSYNGTE